MASEETYRKWARAIIELCKEDRVNLENKPEYSFATRMLDEALEIIKKGKTE